MDGRTRLLGIIGKPIAHSLSPIMYNAAFKARGLKYRYLAFEIQEDILAETLDGFRKMDFLGLNVTIPYKSRVMKYLDRIDDQALRIGAVNTVVNDGDSLVGYNTDAPGAVDALSEAGVDLDGSGSVLIIGAGDSARTLCFAMADSGYDLFITNRTMERAERLAADVDGITSAVAVDPGEIETRIDDVSIIINCTSVGMKGGPAGCPISSDLLRKDMDVFDIVYTPMETPILSEAKRRGARIVHGYRMLLGQGLRSYQLWTGNEGPRDVMEKAILDGLGEK